MVPVEPLNRAISIKMKSRVIYNAHVSMCYILSTASQPRQALENADGAEH
jgi:hypothetical protein